MSDVLFPSGQWIGFYTYPHRSTKYLMDLILEFRDGIVSGEGSDGIGFFAIDGRYYPQEAECLWIKTYFGRHSVEYYGFREKKGIWGTWTIGRAKGGFHIWPIGEGQALEKLKAEVEEEFPLRPAAPGQLNPVSIPTGGAVPAGFYVAKEMAGISSVLPGRNPR